MYKIVFSLDSNLQINSFVNSYKTSFLTRFFDTWIFDEDLIVNNYIKLSEEFKVKIYNAIIEKLKEDLVFWRMISEKEVNSIFIIVWNYRILLDYKENIENEVRIVQEINFYKK